MKLTKKGLYTFLIIILMLAASLCYEAHIFNYYSIVQAIISLILIFILMLYFKFEKKSDLEKILKGQTLIFVLLFLRIINTLLGLLFFEYNTLLDVFSVLIMTFTTFALFYTLPDIIKRNVGLEHTFINLYIIICVVLSIFSIALKLNGGHLLFWKYVYVVRDASLYYDPNFLAMVLGSGMTLALLYKFKNRLIKWLYILLIAVAIFLTGSRGTVLSLIVAIFIYLILYSNLSISKKIVILVALGIITYYGVSYLYSIDFFRTYQGSNNRFEMWSRSIKYSFKSPLFGYGYGSIDSMLKSMNFVNASTHNSFLDFLLIYGYPAFFIYLVVIMKILLKSINNKTNKLYILTIIFMLIDANTILYSFGGVGLSSLMFTVILGLLNYQLNIGDNIAKKHMKRVDL